jgi:hypothetical protein
MVDTLGSTVMIRDWYGVPAIPDVPQGRPIDPKVELVVLTVEYWVRSAPQSQETQRRELLKVLPGRIHATNADEFVWLLVRRGVADEFFDLTRTAVDRDRSLLTFLESNGIPRGVIAAYASWNGIHPKEFTDGFFVGLGQSVATAVVSLYDLVKFVDAVQRELMADVIQLVVDPQRGVATLREQAVVVGQVFDALVAQLDPTEIPNVVAARWRNWNVEFARHLENLDPFEAGRQLGRIGGDLFQLLTGVLGVMKLLVIAGKVALRYAPLLLGSVRRAAAEAVSMVRQLGALLLKIGQETIDRISRIGLGALRELFPPAVWHELVTNGRALIGHGEFTLMPVFQGAYATAFGGTLRPRFGVLVAEGNKPLFMAAMSEGLPGFPWTEWADEALDRLKLLVTSRPPRTVTPAAATVQAARLAMLEQRFSTHLLKTLQKIAYEEFVKLVRSKRRFYATDLGKAVHKRMAAIIANEVAQASPGLRTLAEMELRTAMSELARVLPDLQADIKGIVNRLNERLAAMVAKRPDILSILGIPDTPAARTERAVAKVLADRFGWKPTTTLGDIRSDVLLVDGDVRRVINVDYTPVTKADRFTQLYRKVFGDLAEGFDGDWDALDQAYKKARGTVPKEVADQLEWLTNHATRETVVRWEVLKYVFGDGWNVTSHEMFYDGLAKLWKSIPAKAAGAAP